MSRRAAARNKRVTKLGIGASRSPFVASEPPPPVSCPAPRVPLFPIESDAGEELAIELPPVESRKPASGIRRRPALDERGAAENAEALERVPHLAEGRDLTAAPLEPRDAFLLSRVDGRLTVAELADLIGLPAAEALAMLDRMSRLELVELR